MPTVPRTIALLAAAIASMPGAFAQTVEDQLAPLRQLLLDNRLPEAERLVRKVLPTPAAEPKQESGFNISAYDAVWTLIVTRYLDAGDYASAERVARDRLQLAERPPGAADQKRIQLFTFLLAENFRTQGKYAAAAPFYERLLQIDARNELSADFQLKSYLGMAETWMAEGQAAEAELLLKPMVFAEGADPARPAAFHEELYNAYSVSLTEAGQKTEADKITAQVARDSSRPPELDQQDRDLLRARLLRTRGSFAEAEAIYRKWTKYWDDHPPAPGGVRPGQAEPRLRPLQEYAHFLTLRSRQAEAQAARARLTKLEREYNQF